ncbi:hypothetical protein IJ847_00505 [Candidatus Saccharibacteria bacterium]|nr:hypothetical protein [Candidatus Saccharibacteria bacterium]
MKIIRKMKLSQKDVNYICEELDGYIWAVFDTSKGIMIAGDEYMLALRDCLLARYHSQPSDIFGVGINLKDGNCENIYLVNRLNDKVGRDGSFSEENARRLNDLIYYFFENLPAYEGVYDRPHYTRDELLRALRYH